MTHDHTPTHERPDPGGVVRRGEAAENVWGYEESFGEQGPCHAGAGSREGLHTVACDRGSVMEVYGLPMCEAHGEEAAAMALEEIYNDLENELGRPMNRAVRALSPHLSAALSLGFGVLEGDHTGTGGADAALLEAFPLRREEVCVSILHYLEAPDRDHEPPYEAFMDDRMLVHRLMRLAFEQNADWLVETLEKERVQVAAQAAYALALDPHGAECRPAGEQA